MKIRLANKFDLPYFIESVKKLHNYDHNQWSSDLAVDDLHINKLFQTLINGMGIVYVAEKDNKPVGMIAGIITPFMWAPNVNMMYQILFHVEQVTNAKKIGYKLIETYNKAGNELMENKRIYKYAFTVSEPMFDLNLEKFNYNLIEKTWLVGA